MKTPMQQFGDALEKIKTMGAALAEISKRDACLCSDITTNECLCTPKCLGCIARDALKKATGQ